jgi:glutamate formiminotransferase/formiminotetrahydrofolate cyclodeaminase
MKKSMSCYPLIREMVHIGNPNSLSDAAVGALCIRAAVYGAYLNVKINAGGLKDRVVADAMVGEAVELLAESNAEEADILRITEGKL